MLKPITYYCSLATDEPVLRQLQVLLAAKEKSIKVDLAYMALTIYCFPNLPIPPYDGLIEESLYLKQLSSQGLLDLCCALLEEARNQ